MVFAPEVQVLQCSYCSSKRNIELQPTVIREYDFDSADDTANLSWGTETRVFHCNNCGADTVIDSFAKSHSCAFCGSTHVIRQETQETGIAPESLVPFKVTKIAALDNFNKWIGSRFFAPRALKNSYQKDSIKGAYIPFWTYDADTDSNYSAQAGTYYYVTEPRTVRDKDGKTRTEYVQVRKTRWRPVTGRFNRHFNDHLVNASRNIEEGLLGKIEPFDLNQLVPYSPEFLAGFLAERYSINLKDGWERAKGRLSQTLHTEITRHIAADEVRGLNVNTNWSNIKYKHFLLPIWLSSYTYKDKIYHFMVNGQTGRVHGEAPTSFWKVAGVVAAVAAVIGLVVYIFMMNAS